MRQEKENIYLGAAAMFLLVMLLLVSFVLGQLNGANLKSVPRDHICVAPE